MWDVSSGRPAALGSLASGHPKKGNHLVPPQAKKRKQSTWSLPVGAKKATAPPTSWPRDHVHPPRETCTLLAAGSCAPAGRGICPGCRIHAISRPHASAPPTLPSSSSARQKQIQTQSPPALLPPPTQPPWEPQSRRSCFKI